MQHPVGQRKHNYDFALLEKKSGIPRKTIRARLDAGMDLDEALSVTDYRKNKKHFTYFWNELQGLPEIARFIGVSVPTLKRYMRMHDNNFDEVYKTIKARPENGYERAKAQPVLNDTEVPVPQYSPQWALALGMISKGKYNELTK